MKRRYVLTGLGIVASLALITTAIAGTGDGPSAKSAAKAKKGKPGPRGPAGPAGPAGAQGPQGIQGNQGIQGPAATKLLACRAVDGTACTATEGANTNVTGVTHTPASGVYVVSFNQSVVGCNAHAQLNLPGETATGTGNPTSNDISVSTFNSAGTAADRGFRLAVFC